MSTSLCLPPGCMADAVERRQVRNKTRDFMVET